ncbi:MAG: hypothetical protein EPN84_08085 [Legionella sp.]|nr:MAG: hypothetical protein EPN84_08085 [Legionella sp.]
MKHCYAIYDFIIQSDLELPSLPSYTGSFENNSLVKIQYAAIDAAGLKNPNQQGFTHQRIAKEFWFQIPPIAKFLISNGDSISIDPRPGIDDDSIRAFLLSTCLEILLRQRNHLVIAGYSLKLDRQGILFAGIPNNGQAMLQGLLYKKGYTFLSSQFTAVNAQAELLPGVPQLEFWPAVASALDLGVPGLSTIRPEIKKYLVPLKQQYQIKPIKLTAIYTLKMHQQTEIKFAVLEGKKKKQCLEPLMRNNQVGVDLWYENNQPLPHLEILDNIPLVVLQVPTRGLKLHSVIQALENDIVERSATYA